MAQWKHASVSYRGKHRNRNGDSIRVTCRKIAEDENSG